MSDVKPGDRVTVLRDGDGADGVGGVVDVVFRSGRVQVSLDCGGFRNLRQDQIKKETAA